MMGAGRWEKVDERRRDRADRRPVISRRAGLSAIAGSRTGSPRGRHRLPGRRARRFPRSAGPGAVSARRGRARHRREGRAIIRVIARLPAPPARGSSGPLLSRAGPGGAQGAPAAAPHFSRRASQHSGRPEGRGSWNGLCGDRRGGQRAHLEGAPAACGWLARLCPSCSTLGWCLEQMRTSGPQEMLTVWNSILFRPGV